ncbi:MAG: hypothetical protein K2Q26_05320 [Bdellovibrionales bacterium]|nr:hypothetical protein [Bdellovibrionales bacterium]
MGTEIQLPPSSPQALVAMEIFNMITGVLFSILGYFILRAGFSYVSTRRYEGLILVYGLYLIFEPIDGRTRKLTYKDRGNRIKFLATLNLAAYVLLFPIAYYVFARW